MSNGKKALASTLSEAGSDGGVGTPHGVARRCGQVPGLTGGCLLGGLRALRQTSGNSFERLRGGHTWI